MFYECLVLLKSMWFYLFCSTELWNQGFFAMGSFIVILSVVRPRPEWGGCIPFLKVVMLWILKFLHGQSSFEGYSGSPGICMLWVLPSWLIFGKISNCRGRGGGGGNPTALMCWFSNRHVGFCFMILVLLLPSFIFLYVFMKDLFNKDFYMLLFIIILEIVYSRCKRIYDDDDFMNVWHSS